LPVHAIVWAKELYKLLFHPKVEESMLYEAVDGEEDGGGEDEEGEEAGGGGHGTREPSTYMRAVLDYRGALARAAGADDVSKDGDANGKGVEGMARDILRRLYGDEIRKQLGMGRYKAARKTPVPLDVEELLPAGGGGGEGGGGGSANAAGSRRHDQVWTRGQCAHEFVRCLADAAALLASSSLSPPSPSSSERGGGAPARVLAEFDKDDDLGMRLVTAAANLRSYAFGIEPIQSYYSAKVRETAEPADAADDRKRRKVTAPRRRIGRAPSAPWPPKGGSFFARTRSHKRHRFSSPAFLPFLFSFVLLQGIAGNIIPAVRSALGSRTPGRS
jgi:ubiquitin-like 1-activating enzyme E1 B